MIEYEGSRAEFLKLLAEFGEEPAFVVRGRAPQLALDALLRHCQSQRIEMLEWPRRKLILLASKIGGDWSRLNRYFHNSESTGLLAVLHAQITESTIGVPPWYTTEKGALREFLDSAQRFNRDWSAFLERLDLGAVNQARRDYNQFYPLEKACAFGMETVSDGFTSMPPLEIDELAIRFPLLVLPKLR